MEIENNINIIKLNRISEKNFIIAKEKFNCNICLENDFFIKFTRCCQNFICSNCSMKNIRDFCPLCKKEIKIIETDLLKNIFLNSLYYCEECKKNDTLEIIINHIISNHFETDEDIKKILKNGFLTEILFKKFEINKTKKFLFHNHIMKLKPKTKASECRGGTLFNYPKCEYKIQNISSENENYKKEIYSNLHLTNEENFEKKKVLFSSFFYFYCEECDYFFCNECKEIKKLFILQNYININ